MTKKIPEIIAVDLFAGSGGFSTGLLEAANDLGAKVKLTAVNHWKTAVDSHALNHPNVAHLCEDVETLHPRDVVPDGHLHVLLASPECTFHSVARGGGPCNEQSRAQPWQIIRWITDLQVDAIVLENVWEATAWTALLTKDTRIAGKLHKKLTPDPRRKGEYFQNFINTLKLHGYNVEYKKQCAADYGDPTKRQRLILLARRDNQPITWPTPTHADPAKIVAGQLPWLTARDHVIDWSLEGKSIFNRKKPLSANTIRRIAAGLTKFGGPAAEPFLIMLRGLSESHIKMSATSVDTPIRALTAGGTHVGLVEPFILPKQSKDKAHSTKQPVGSITTKSGHALIEPVMVPVNYGERKGQKPRTCNLSEPMPTVVGSPSHGVAVPIITHVTHHGKRPQHSVDDPLPTVTGAHRGELALVQPVIVQTDQTGSNGCCAQSVDRPLVTVVGRANMGVVEPILVQTDQTGAEGHCSRPTDEPVRTVVSKQNMGLVEPYILPKEGYYRGNTPKSLDQSLGTVTTEERATLVQPVLVKYYGTGTAVSVDAPLDTVTTKDRFLLVCPKTGEVQAELDIRFRMLQPAELAAAHSFPKNYKFAGNKSDATKMIGNSIPVQLARAHTRMALQGIINT